MCTFAICAMLSKAYSRMAIIALASFTLASQFACALQTRCHTRAFALPNLPPLLQRPPTRIHAQSPPISLRYIDGTIGTAAPLSSHALPFPPDTSLLTPLLLLLPLLAVAAGLLLSQAVNRLAQAFPEEGQEVGHDGVRQPAGPGDKSFVFDCDGDADMAGDRDSSNLNPSINPNPNPNPNLCTTPPYLLSAILSGLDVLPPEHILKRLAQEGAGVGEGAGAVGGRGVEAALEAGLGLGSSQRGRKVQYSKYRHVSLAAAWRPLSPSPSLNPSFNPCPKPSPIPNPNFNPNLNPNSIKDPNHDANPNPTHPLFSAITRASLRRLMQSDTTNPNPTPNPTGTLHIYKFTLPAASAAAINDSILAQLRLMTGTGATTGLAAGMSVSNAGGYHSITNCFEDDYYCGYNTPNPNPNPGLRPYTKATPDPNIDPNPTPTPNPNAFFGLLCQQAVAIAEADDCLFDPNPNPNPTPYPYPYPNPNPNPNKRLLQPYPQAEAWINRNTHGNWNSLHTHRGAAWSGIYYVQVRVRGG